MGGWLYEGVGCSGWVSVWDVVGIYVHIQYVGSMLGGCIDACWVGSSGPCGTGV